MKKNKLRRTKVLFWQNVHSLCIAFRGNMSCHFGRDCSLAQLWVLALFAIWSSINVNLVENTGLHLWRGKFVFYSGRDVTMGLMEAEERCSKLGGQMPSVHSKEDVNQLVQLIGHNTRLWLGSKPQDNSSPFMPRGTYEWTDGTKFDYQGWVPGAPDCSSDCCGVGVTTIAYYGQGLYDIECTNQRSMVCIMPILTNQTVQEWLKSELAKINSSSKESTAQNLAQQLSIDLLNETMTNMQHFSIFLFQQVTRIENQYNESVRSLNASLGRNMAKLQQVLVSVQESLSQESDQASQVGHQNKFDLESLSSQIDACFVIMSLLLIAIVLAVMIKVDLISCSSIKKSSSFYAQYIRHPKSRNSPSSPARKDIYEAEYETIGPPSRRGPVDPPLNQLDQV